MEDYLRIMGEAERDLERVVSRMKQIQRDISRSSQPASIMQLEELKELGREYARIIDRLGNLPGGSALA
ncbi:MAG: hypothetical protein WBO34_07000 [Gammaproteobacteria bacterium]